MRPFRSAWVVEAQGNAMVALYEHKAVTPQYNGGFITEQEHISKRSTQSDRQLL
jgi:hypothetical protein